MKRLFVVILCLAFLMGGVMALPANACTISYNPWVWDSSVTPTALSVKLCSSQYQNSLSSSNSIFVWNGISSGIRITSYTAAADSATMDADINMQFGTLSNGVWGRTRYYTRNPATGTLMEVSNTTISVLQVRLTFSENIFDDGTAYANRTVMHEMGHALALRHPTCTASAVMHQRTSSYHAMTIKQHDKDLLEEKWGE